MTTANVKFGLQPRKTNVSAEEFGNIKKSYGDADAQAAFLADAKKAGWVVNTDGSATFTKQLYQWGKAHSEGRAPDCSELGYDDIRAGIEQLIREKVYTPEQLGDFFSNGINLGDKPKLKKRNADSIAFINEQFTMFIVSGTPQAKEWTNRWLGASDRNAIAKEWWNAKDRG